MADTKKLNWTYGENPYQRFYDTYVGKDYLLVFANKAQPDVWMGNQRGVMLYDKTANDKQRRKQGVPVDCCLRDHPLHELHSVTILSSHDPEYMMRKVEFAYENNLLEVNR